MTTMPALLQAAAEAGEGAITFHLDDGVVRRSSADLATDAERDATALAALGAGPGAAVGLLGPNRPEWARWCFAIWRAGATVVPLAWTPLRDPAAYTSQTEALARAAGCRFVLVSPLGAPALPAGSARNWDDVPAVVGPPPDPPAPDDIAVVQFTSGSSADPKGALVTHRGLVRAVHGLDRLLEGLDEDLTSGWLPFFHDWGLVQLVARGAVRGAGSHVLPTERFLRDPVEWLRVASGVRAEVLLAPPTAWPRMLRRLDPSEPIDLSGVRSCSLSAERVSAEVVDQIRSVGRAFGLHENAPRTAYGMAEATLAVTATELDAPLRMTAVDRRRLQAERVAIPAQGGLRMVSCGRPLEDWEVVVSDDAGARLPDGAVGEIEIRGPSLFAGYVGAEGTGLRDGWLPTGDLGYLDDGELYVTGRRKDVIVVLGHNHAAEDLEWVAETVVGVRPGRCVAFAHPEEEGTAVVLVETAGRPAPDVAREVRRALATHIGLPRAEVLVVAPGTVAKTSSGKLRRSAMRGAYAEGTFVTLAGS